MTDNVLIAGCGDVGNALATRLLAEGCAVWGIRRTVDALAPGVTPWRIDLRDRASLGAPPAAFDYLFYTASADGRDEESYRAIYVDALRDLLEVLRSEGSPLHRVFFTSSTAVYGQSEGEWVDRAFGLQRPYPARSRSNRRPCAGVGGQCPPLRDLRTRAHTTDSQRMAPRSQRYGQLDQSHSRRGLRGSSASPDAIAEPRFTVPRIRRPPGDHCGGRDVDESATRRAGSEPGRNDTSQQALQQRASSRKRLSVSLPELPRGLSRDDSRVSEGAGSERVSFSRSCE